MEIGLSEQVGHRPQEVGRAKRASLASPVNLLRKEPSGKAKGTERKTKIKIRTKVTAQGAIRMSHKV